MYEKHNFKTGQVLTADVLNEMEDGIYKSSVYTTPFTLIDLATDFFAQDDGYTMPCPQELVDAVHNGLTIVMPYGLGNSGGYTANVKFSDREISLEFLLNSILFDCSLVRMRAIRHIETGVLEFIKGANYSTFVYYQPLLTSGETIKTIASNGILGSGNLPAKDILKESTVFLEFDQTLEDHRRMYKDKAGYEAHNLKVYKRIATAIHYNPDKIVPNTEMFFVNILNSGDIKDIHTGILECIAHEYLHSTIFSSHTPITANVTSITSIGVDCELIIDAAEGGEMPIWQGVTIPIPLGSNYVKNISFNGTTYSGNHNNVVTLPSLMTNTERISKSLTVDLTTNVLVVTSEVTDIITINSFGPSKGMSQVGRVYFHHVAGQPLNINLTFTHYWENGENPSGTITEECFCELIVKRIATDKSYYDLVSLKTYKQ